MRHNNLPNMYKNRPTRNFGTNNCIFYLFSQNIRGTQKPTKEDKRPAPRPPPPVTATEKYGCSDRNI